MTAAALTCSAAAADLPLPGTAAVADGWLCIEQPGAWGRDILGDAVLGGEITAWLQDRAKAARVRPMLIRQPGRASAGTGRTVLLASVRPGHEWCERIELGQLSELTQLDLAVVHGPPPGLGAPVTEPVLLVCTHGKRDQCCALLGRPIAASLATQFPGQVWECSHTGGHRFAPSAVALPSGLTYGRVDTADGAAILRAITAGEVYLPGLRGRSGQPPVAQVAEIAVRQHISAGISGVAVTANGASATVTVENGQAWEVSVRAEDRPARPASCGANAKPTTILAVSTIDPPLGTG